MNYQSLLVLKLVHHLYSRTTHTRLVPMTKAVNDRKVSLVHWVISIVFIGKIDAAHGG
jgi:hypothetical protein